MSDILINLIVYVNNTNTHNKTQTPARNKQTGCSAAVFVPSIHEAAHKRQGVTCFDLNCFDRVDLAAIGQNCLPSSEARAA